MRAISTAGWCRARALQRHEEVARIVTGNPRATVEEGAAWLESLAVDLGIPKLTQLCEGFDAADTEQVATIVEESKQSSSMKGNPIELTSDELEEILLSACK